MLNSVIEWSLNNRFLVILFALIGSISGVIALGQIPMDAFPDTTPVQVQINTVAPALSPSEIEQIITFPIEQAVAGIPRILELRSISKFGLSQVSLIFKDGTDIYFARQRIMERLQTVELPESIARPEMGPVATGLGEVYHYIVTGKKNSLEELTTIHDWVIKPRLLSVPGVAEVNTWGGETRQYHVLIEMPRLIQYDLKLEDVVSALQSNNLNVGGGNIEQAGESTIVKGIGIARTVSDIGRILIRAQNGRPLRIRDIARVEIGHELRRGACTANGQGEVVLGLGFMLMGENSQEITRRLKETMRDILPTLPEGVHVQALYERTELVDNVISTVKRNLYEGAILVVAVLFIFLGDLKAGLIVAAAIPLSMLFAFNGMLQLGITGSLLSLGAIDFGLIVDSSVIMVENSVRRLAENQGRRSVIEVVSEASIEVRKPTMFGELIIMIVYLPILTLEGVEGRLFQPMALTVILALTSSLILSMTLMPVLASLFLSDRSHSEDMALVRLARWLYQPVLRLAIRAHWFFIALALMALGIAGVLASRLGSEFIPRLSEMSIVINSVRLSGVSLEESVRYGSQIEKILLREFPDEIENVWVRTGTAEVATDPMGIELSDIFVTLKPRATWTRAASQAELSAIMREELSALPGMRLIFTQPIEMRVNEMVAGIRADLGVKIFGQDMALLKVKARQVAQILESMPETTDISVEQITGQPVLEIEVDPEASARLGLSTQDVLRVVESVGGISVGEIRDRQGRFELVVRLAKSQRSDPDALYELLVPTPSGQGVPLSKVARLRRSEGPTTITRESMQRRIVVQCNLKGHDIGGFVKQLRERLDQELALPEGYHFDFGGQFEHLLRAQSRLLLIVPLALGLILLLLYASTKSLLDSLIIFTGAPFAALGGVIALSLREMPFTIAAGVGFVAVSGVAMLNGLVMAASLRQLMEQGTAREEAIERSALARLRPILMTALVAGLGFVPMAFSSGVGAEIQRPLATVVIGGVISDNVLTLLVLPALYAALGRFDPPAARAEF